MRSFISACLILLGWLGVVEGQSLKDESESTMAQSMMYGFDTNKDGQISFQELQDHVGDNSGFEGWQAGFREADGDKDGRLTVEELEILLTHASKTEKDALVDDSEKSIAESVMDGFDTNKDGKLSLTELKEHVGNQEVHAAFQGWEEGFKQADSDNDEHLTLSELASLLAQVSGEDHQKIVEDSEESIAASIMDGFDNDKDRKLSLMELVEHIGKNQHVQTAFQGWESGFKDADADKDGHLTVHELADLLSHISRKGQQDMVEESQASLAASVLDGFDADKNGQISLQELLDRVGNTDVHAAFAGWMAGFKQADVDNDGELTAEELTNLFAHVSREDQYQLVRESEESLATSIMDGFDTDKDGKLSFQELKGHVGDKAEGQAAFAGWEEGFKEADVDKDEHLTIHELASLLSHVSSQEQRGMVHESEKTIGESILEGFDADKDGKLSLQELLEHVGDHQHIHAAFKGWQEGFAEADVDKNGFLTAEELTNLIHHVSRQDQQRMIEESHAAIAASIMDGFDTDKDRLISIQELMDRVGDTNQVHAAFAGWAAGFREADVNNDGHLTIEELTSMLGQISREEEQEMLAESEESIAQSIMDGFDTDRDGKLSLKELKEHVGDKAEGQAAFVGWEEGFKEADVDKDEHLTVHELSRLLSHVSRQNQKGMVHESEKSIGASILEGFDADKDGKLTLKEMMEHVGDAEHIHAAFKGWQQGFLEADVDADGFLTEDELTGLIHHVSRQDQQKMVDESHQQMYSMLLDGFDADKNGKLSLKELKEHMEGDTKVHAGLKGWEDGFENADADKDGHLSSDELKHFFGHVGKNFHKHFLSESEQSVVRTMMKAFDTDKSSTVSMEEMMAQVAGKNERGEVEAFLQGWQNGFKEADADQDGQLNSEEMLSLINHVQRDHRHKLVNEAEKTAASVMQGFDDDNDGKISLKELESKIGAKGPSVGSFNGWRSGFKEADADKDGFLTADELAAWFQQVGATPQHDEM